MAITNCFAKFLFHLKKNNINFERTLTLGRLRLYTESQKLNEIAEGMGVILNFDSTDGQSYSERFFELLGAQTIDSMDYSAYEEASILHDLNEPLPTEMHQKYSLVLDSGTLEHVFNFPVAIKSCMETLSVGGTYVGITPANNMMGHGFYQFSPELYYRIFSQENGFKIKYMFIGILNEKGQVEKWYDVKDPADVKARVTLRNFKETFLFIAAEKIEQIHLFTSNPFQSDYVSTWKKTKEKSEVNVSYVKKIYKENIPEQTQAKFRKIKEYIFRDKKFKNESIGVIDSHHFTEIRL